MTQTRFQEIDFEAFYTLYGPMVMRRCRRILKDEQSAFDAMQEVFLKVLQKKKTLRVTHPSSLLYRMATNTCINRIRSERKHEIKKYLDIFQNTSFFEMQEEEITAKYLFEFVLKKEKGTTRKIAVMYFLNGMTIKEVAETIKLSTSGVHKHLEKLKRAIKKMGEDS
ncbi:RNA polymerase sigma factor [Acidobacteriota bacterium]